MMSSLRNPPWRQLPSCAKDVRARSKMAASIRLSRKHSFFIKITISQYHDIDISYIDIDIAKNAFSIAKNAFSMTSLEIMLNLEAIRLWNTMLYAHIPLPNPSISFIRERWWHSIYRTLCKKETMTTPLLWWQSGLRCWQQFLRQWWCDPH